MIPTNLGDMSVIEALNELLYISYSSNRDRSPHIAPQRWQPYFGDSTVEFEARYQAEKAVARASA